MSDLKARLRQRIEEVYAGHGNVKEIPDADCQEAADRVEALETELCDLSGKVRSAGEAGHFENWEPAYERAQALVNGAEPTPIPMVLICPRCDYQHIDKPDPESGWANPPHKSHLCGACGCIWRPADVPTTGVAEVSTRGKADNWP